MPGDRQDLLSGTIVAGYRVEREVGRGAMAVVYRAIQLNLERPVALKVLTGELARDQEFVVRFFNEARAAAQLTHPNIVQAYDAGVADENLYYFAMEYVEGETVLSRIGREGFLKLSIGLPIALDIADALDYGWQRQQLTHGDIKPENIMLNSSGETKLADFGLAKVVGHEFVGSEIMLTPLYGAPELIKGERRRGDCRADIYSLGATVYHMLCGVPPFPGDDPREVMDRHLHEPLTPLTQRNSAVPREVSDFVGSLLAKTPEARPATWEEVKSRLKRLRRAKPRTPIKRSAVTNVSPAAVQQAIRGQARTKSTSRGGLLAAGITAGFVLVFLLMVWQRAGTKSGSSMAPPGPTAPQSGPALVQERVEQAVSTPSIDAAPMSAATAWAQVCARLPRARHPAEAVRLLEEYAGKYKDSLPQEYHDRLRQYQVALQWRQAAEKAQERSGSLLDGEPEPTPDGQVTPRSEQREKGEVREQRLASLARGTAGAGVGGDSGREPAQPVQDVGGRPEGTAADMLAVDQTEDNRRKDDCREYIAALAAFQYEVGGSVEALVRKGNEWLAAHTGRSSERATVRFAVEVVLPSLEAFHPKLLTRKKALIGERLPGRKFAQEGRIKDVALQGILLEKHTQHGTVTHPVPWSALDHPAYMVFLGKRVFSGQSLSLVELRPYLALLAMTRSLKFLDAELEGVPELPEKRHWQQLRVDLESGVQEGDALVNWRASKAAYANGEYVQAYGLLQHLKSSRTSVAFRYREAVERMEQDCVRHVPHHQAGELVRKAQALLLLEPVQAVALLDTAWVRYGNVDFPERSEIDALRQKAVASLPRAEWTQSLLSRPAGAFRPFLYEHPGLDAGFWLLLYGKLKEDEAHLPKSVRTALPNLRGLALLRAGIWDGAHELLAQEPQGHSVLPPGYRLCLLYGRGVTAARFGDEDVAGADVLARFHEVIQSMHVDDGSAVAGAALMVEYAVATEQYELEPDSVVMWAAIRHRRSDRGSKRRFVLGALGWLIEAGHVAQASTVIEQITTDASTLAGCDFSEDDGPFLKSIAQHLRDGSGLQIPRLDVPFPFREHVVRVLLSALARRSVVSSESQDKAESLPSLESCALHSSPIGDSVCFALVLRAVQGALLDGDAAAAVAAVDQALALPSPTLSGHFPRLCFLKAGAQALDGKWGRARETLALVRGSTVVNGTELLLSKCCDKESGRVKLPSRVNMSRDGRFWLAWLLGARAHALEGSGSGEVAKAAEAMGENAGSLMQKRLAFTLRRLARAATALDPAKGESAQEL